MKDMPWDRGLAVTADGDGLAGHAGGVILREMADRSGLTSALKDALAREGRFPEIDRGAAMVSAAVMIALGGESMSGIAVLEHLSAVLGEPVTWQTLRRTLDLADPATLGKIAQARTGILAHVWELIAARAGGFPWLEIAGRILEGWTVIDMDATLITAYSRKGTQPARVTPDSASTRSVLVREHDRVPAHELRPDAVEHRIGSHLRLSASLSQVPACYRRKILVRLDGADEPRFHHAHDEPGVPKREAAVHQWLYYHRNRRGRHPEIPRTRGNPRHADAHAETTATSRDHWPDEQAGTGRPACAVSSAGEAVPQALEEPHRLREETAGSTLSSAPISPRKDWKRPGAGTPSSSTCCTASTPSSRRVRTGRPPAAGLPLKSWRSIALDRHREHRRRSAVMVPSPRALRHRDLKNAEPGTLRHRLWRMRPGSSATPAAVP